MNYRHLPALLALWACPALAHVTANPDNGAAGSYFETALRISHGCKQSATTAIRVSIPDGILSVRPQAKAGWKIELTKKKLPAPVKGAHGKMVEEVITEISWVGGNLPSDQYDTFGLLLKLPEKTETLWFPVKQQCGQGENDWMEIPKEGQDWHDMKGPAPFVKITPATVHQH